MLFVCWRGKGYGGRASLDVSLSGLVKSMRDEDCNRKVNGTNLFNPSRVRPTHATPTAHRKGRMDSAHSQRHASNQIFFPCIFSVFLRLFVHVCCALQYAAQFSVSICQLFRSSEFSQEFLRRDIYRQSSQGSKGYLLGFSHIFFPFSGDDPVTPRPFYYSVSI